MCKFLTGLFFGAVMFGGAAQAADPVDPAYDWTGFYAGLHGGYAFGGHDQVGLAASNGIFADAGVLKLEGIYGGGQIGYNLQTGDFVYGFEADVSAGDVNDSIAFTGIGAFGDSDGTASSDVGFFGTFRGRLGFAVDRTLFYGTGGLAWGDVDYRVNAVDGGGNTVAIDQSKFEFGFALGGGIEHAISDDFTIGLQYMYYNLYGDTLRGNVLDVGGVPNGVTVDTVRTTDFHTVEMKVNWNF